MVGVSRALQAALCVQGLGLFSAPHAAPVSRLSSCSSWSRTTLPGTVELLQLDQLATPSSARNHRRDTLCAVGSAGPFLLGEPGGGG